MPLPALGVGALWVGAGLVLRRFGVWLVSQAPSIVAWVLSSLGLYFFVSKPLSENLVQFVVSRFGGLPATVAETLYYLNVDNYLTMVLSAYTVRAAMSAGTIALKKKSTGQGGAP